MKAKIITIIILISLINCVSAQSCDTIDSKIQKKYDSYSKRKMNKLLLAENKKLYEWFNIAEYLRIKGDTIYKLWYQKIVKIMPSAIKNHYYDGYSNVRRTQLFYIGGLSYYYTGNFLQAKKYFSAVLTRTSNNHPCAGFYMRQIEFKIKSTE